MKRLLGPVTLILVLGLYVLANLLPIFGFPISLNYPVAVAFYLCIITILWSETNSLSEFHLDNISLWIIAISGIVRSRLSIPNEIYYLGALILLGLVTFVTLILVRRKLPKSSSQYAILGLLACLFAIPISLIESLQPARYGNINIMPSGLVFTIVRRILENLSYDSLLEETIFRGILWGYLGRLGWGEKKIFWSQAVFFWLLHLWQIGTPLTFFITIPIGTILFSVLASRSKQILPSIIVHTFFNVVGPFLVYFYLR
jgi:membrane protease YdiL (CAAX protease family)